MSGAAAGAIIAAQHQQRIAAEEERMAGYRPEDLEGWEFKILRTTGGAFRTPEKLHEVLTEESRAGWELLEKFDEQRLRLKRPTRARERDYQLDFDPYRTYVGMTPNMLGLVVLGVVFGVLALGAVVAATLH